jgi:MFS transporter, putative metabolite:H+ symporter
MGATILPPLLAKTLFRRYGLHGAYSLMIGFLLVQVVVIVRFGIEAKEQRLEDMDDRATGNRQRGLPSCSTQRRSTST